MTVNLNMGSCSFSNATEYTRTGTAAVNHDTHGGAHLFEITMTGTDRPGLPASAQATLRETSHGSAPKLPCCEQAKEDLREAIVGNMPGTCIRDA